MDQLDKKEPEYKKCIQCKQLKPNVEHFCEDCVSEIGERKYGKCVECMQIYTGLNWCQACNSKRFQQNFGNWTSGNDDIDKFIQNTQLSAKNHY
jgi:hypothetical protein